VVNTHSSFLLPTPDEKPGYVKGLFKRIANYYDMMNDVMTVGMHRQWKRQACLKLSLKPGSRVLDLCCGTGDLIFYLSRLFPGVTVTGLDFSPEMLAVAQQRLNKQATVATLVQGDAMALPFEPESFEGAIIAYGLRNVSDYRRCLEELYLVLTPGSKLVVLDMSHPTGVMNVLSSFYRFTIVPLTGKLLTQNGDAYHYLSNSIFTYPNQKKLVCLMQEAGFQQVSYQNLVSGVCAIHVGQR
jgi:demethylmenaquinone methyltransferase / 2-methoxy-6-polyprenyl-1,4-benzoquinol methylase